MDRFVVVAAAAAKIVRTMYDSNRKCTEQK
jgi:hypothetical protein